MFPITDKRHLHPGPLPIFIQFTDANVAMLECYNKVDYEQYKGQPEGKSANVCMKEREKVKDILKSNELTMTRIVEERVGVI